ERPEKKNGWADIRIYKHMGVAAGAAVGGGSLIYASVHVKAPDWVFNSGWPAEITWEGMQQYYDTVGKMLDLQEIPDNQLTKRSMLMKEAAEARGWGDRFGKVHLAVTFDKDYDPSKLEDYRDEKHSKEFTNAHGQKQGTCIHLGNCDIGCDVLAKNTLDLNYIPAAEAKGAEVRPLHMVRYIEPTGGGYRVHFDRIQDGRLIPGSETAARVVVAAGSMGSTEILLRCRDQYKTLPNLSSRLGIGWSMHGDFLTPALHKHRDVDPTLGPTRPSVTSFLDGKESGGERFWVQEGGLPPILTDYVNEKLKSGVSGRIGLLLEAMRRHLREDGPIDGVMPWFGQGIDRANGRLFLKRKWYMPWKKNLYLDYDPDDAAGVINGMIDKHESLSEATDGFPVVPPTWRPGRWLITPHPLGGCRIGADADTGVVDHRCQVFGYENLFVTDGAAIPTPIGKNPSRTIAAVAERAGDLAGSS
ncbi:MAG: GMC family oxidoreductase, partial [bacterium]|nr:GMC family oxidoreductase [bacterium]